MDAINYLAVLAAAMVHFGIGGLWYSPALFGKAWISAMQLSAEEIEQMKSQGGRGKTFAISFIGSLVLAFVTAHMVGYTARLFPDISSVSNGLQTGFWLWLGYLATLTLTQVLFERKTWKLFFITNGYQLVGLLAVSVILSVL